MKAQSEIYRNFVVKCRTNRGGKYLVPVAVSEVRLTPEDPACSYDVIRTSEYFGELRAPLEKRGDLVKLKCGDRITRTPRLGKQIRPGRNGHVFVEFRVRVPEFKLFTKRTCDPKLTWLVDHCQSQGLRVFIEGKSWHAPCSYVHRDDYAAAWKILDPIDKLPDNHKKFRS